MAKGLLPSPSSVPCALEGEGSKQEGIGRRPIFIPSTWSADGSCDVPAYWSPDTGTILPSVCVQVTSQQMVNSGKFAFLFWDLLRAEELILCVSVSLCLPNTGKEFSLLDSVGVLKKHLLWHQNQEFSVCTQCCYWGCMGLPRCSGFVGGGGVCCRWLPMPVEGQGQIRWSGRLLGHRCVWRFLWEEWQECALLSLFCSGRGLEALSKKSQLIKFKWYPFCNLFSLSPQLHQLGTKLFRNYCPETHPPHAGKWKILLCVHGSEHLPRCAPVSMRNLSSASGSVPLRNHPLVTSRFIALVKWKKSVLYHDHLWVVEGLSWAPKYWAFYVVALPRTTVYG